LTESTLRWLLEPEDPFIRYQTLVDILGHSPEDKEAIEAQGQVARHSVFKQIMAGQSKAGYWPRKDTCDSPRFTGALWALTLLGEMAVLPDPRIRKECERFFNLHQGENGSFSYRSRLSGKKHYAEPCLQETWLGPCSCWGMTRTLGSEGLSIGCPRPNSRMVVGTVIIRNSKVSR